MREAPERTEDRALTNFIHSDLGNRRAGDVLEVTLSAAANVRLLDSTNFQRYRQGKQHRAYGGLARQSPVRIPIPHNGHWHAAVDMQGLRGSVRAGFRVLNGEAMRPLPPLRQPQPDLADIAHNLADLTTGGEWEFDVFVSHATEDKEDVVRPLALALREHGLSVWYDEFELRIGDSLRRKIDAGIARSRFGVVVLSKAFFAKGWPQYELDGLVSMAVSGRQVLLPVWHNISREEVMAQSPTLVDKVARRTSDFTITEIASEIAAVVAPESADNGR